MVGARCSDPDFPGAQVQLGIIKQHFSHQISTPLGLNPMRMPVFERFSMQLNNYQKIGPFRFWNGKVGLDLSPPTTNEKIRIWPMPKTNKGTTIITCPRQPGTDPKPLFRLGAQYYGWQSSSCIVLSSLCSAHTCCSAVEFPQNEQPCSVDPVISSDVKHFIGEKVNISKGRGRAWPNIFLNTIQWQLVRHPAAISLFRLQFRTKPLVNYNSNKMGGIWVGVSSAPCAASSGADQYTNFQVLLYIPVGSSP